MKTLKVIKPRETEQEVENDLRGLGNEPILNSIDPKVLLIAHGEAVFLTKIEGQLNKHHNLKSQRVSDNRLIITYTAQIPFKEQIVDLFVCGMALTQNLPASSPVTFSLMVNDVFTQKMKLSMAKTTTDLDINLNHIEEFIQTDTFFKVSGVAAPTLKQAGFSVPNVNGDLQLSRKSIESFIATPASEQQRQKKAN